MRYGIATFVTDEGIRPAPLAVACEERGFTSLYIAEHSHIPVSRETPYPGGGELGRVYYRTLDPFVALAAAASVTRTLVLGTGVALVTQRDVIHLANESSSLDLVSDGRFALGVGVGWNREEMRNHGTEPSTRGAKMDEQLAALKAIWTNEQAEYHGKFVDFDPIFQWPKPVRRPHVPIYVGGDSPSALRRLRDFGDGWLPLSRTPPAELVRVRTWLAEHGRTGVPFAIFGAAADRALMDGYAEAEVDEVLLFLPTRSESDTLADLDQLAEFAGAAG